jgi:hypothetical protein
MSLMETTYLTVFALHAVEIMQPCLARVMSYRIEVQSNIYQIVLVRPLFHESIM